MITSVNTYTQHIIDKRSSKYESIKSIHMYYCCHIIIMPYTGYQWITYNNNNNINNKNKKVSTKPSSSSSIAYTNYFNRTDRHKHLASLAHRSHSKEILKNILQNIFMINLPQIKSK